MSAIEDITCQRNMHDALFEAMLPGLINHAKHLRRTSGLNDEQVEDLYVSGYDYFQKGDFDRAAQRFAGAYDLDPANSRYLYALGLALELAGKTTEAQGHYLMLSTLEPNHAKGLFHLGLCLLQEGSKSAGGWFQAALKAADAKKHRVLIDQIRRQLQALEETGEGRLCTNAPKPPEVQQEPSQLQGLDHILEDLAEIQKRLPSVEALRESLLEKGGAEDCCDPPSSCKPSQSAKVEAIFQALDQIQKSHQSILTLERAVNHQQAAVKETFEAGLRAAGQLAKYEAGLRSSNQADEGLESILSCRQSMIDWLAAAKDALDTSRVEGDASELAAILEQLCQIQKEHESLPALKEAVMKELAIAKETLEATRAGAWLPGNARFKPDAERIKCQIALRQDAKLTQVCGRLSRRQFGLIQREQQAIASLAELYGRQVAMEQNSETNTQNTDSL